MEETLTEKIERGIRIAQKRMLEEKALHNRDVVVADANGVIRHIPAKEILKRKEFQK